MLAAASRLRSRAEFTAAVRTGRRAGARLLVIHLAAGEASTDAPPRVGFIVSRTVGGAVVRNQVRRRLRHLMRDRLDTLPPASTLVVRANPAAAGRSSRELARDLDQALARVLEPGPARGRVSA